jgi:hypothetical protein
MPSTIVKLCSSDARAWTHNQPVWLDENGDIARPVTREEQYVISRTIERNKRVDQSFRQTLQLLPVPLAAHGRRPAQIPRPSGQAPQSIDLAFHIEYFGQKRVVTVYAGNLRYAQGREVLAARLLADHGECVLHGRNGKCMAVLRDPLIAERSPNTGRRVQWSRNPEEARQAEERLARQGVTPVKHDRKGIVRGRVSGSSRPVYSPEQCPNDCRGKRGGGEWALAKGAIPPTEKQHHPICKFAPAWAETLEDDSSSAYVLYDLELGTMARRAEPNEIAEADEAERLTKIRQITVGGRLFAVLPADDAEQASREAHGEGDEPSDAFSDGDEQLEVHEPVLDPSRPLTLQERNDWPLLSELSPSEARRQRAEVTARDYLARPKQAGSSA